LSRHLWSGEFGLFATRDFVRASLEGQTMVTRRLLERDH
jgi:hypothetical protein